MNVIAQAALVIIGIILFVLAFTLPPEEGLLWFVMVTVGFTMMFLGIFWPFG